MATIPVTLHAVSFDQIDPEFTKSVVGVEPGSVPGDQRARLNCGHGFTTAEPIPSAVPCALCWLLSIPSKYADLGAHLAQGGEVRARSFFDHVLLCVPDRVN